VTSKREWSLAELVALFPNRRPDPEGVAVSRPAGQGTGRARFTDDAEDAGGVTAEVAPAVAPAREFVVRLGHAWPDAVRGDHAEKLQRGLLLGIFKAVGRFALPSPIGSCEVTTSSVVCDGHTTERAVHVAALRASEAALGACGWTTFTPPFPDVAVEAGADLERSLQRALQAFEAVGYDARETGPSFGCDLSDLERDFTRLFVIMISTAGHSYAHYFFVCPFPWSEGTTAAIEKRLANISYQVGRDGYYGTRFHFLSAHPVPRSLAHRHDVY
jgi:hypothetical protein